MNKLLKNRNFQLWEYKVSHGSLLIRSPKNSDNSENVDIIFIGVEYLSLPVQFSKLEFGNVKQEDINSVGLIKGKYPNKENIFVIKIESTRYYIVAAKMQVSSNNSDIFNSPFEIDYSMK